jgi:hypothetical protein
MDYRSINVAKYGYDFRSTNASSKITDYCYCKEIVLRGCYAYMAEGEDPQLNLRVSENLYKKVIEKWAEYKFPEFTLKERELNIAGELLFDVPFDGIFKSAAWLDVFITFLKILKKYDSIESGCKTLESECSSYIGIKIVMRFVTENIPLVGQIDNKSITHDYFAYNGLIYNRSKFLK